MFSIIIVTWRNSDNANELVRSIRENSYYNTHQVIVVHNEGKHCSSVEGAENIFQDTNIGLSKAANIGSKLAEKSYICLIDDDMTVMKFWDIYLFYAMGEKRSDNWVASTCIEPIAPHYNISTKEWEKNIKPVNYYCNISNTPLLIPASFWREIGGYDEDFPNSGAELGLAKRAYDHGERKFLQIPDSLAWHKQSQSFKKVKNMASIRKKRDIDFKEKYGITRQEFIKIIGKGKKYE